MGRINWNFKKFCEKSDCSPFAGVTGSAIFFIRAMLVACRPREIELEINRGIWVIGHLTHSFVGFELVASVVLDSRTFSGIFPSKPSNPLSADCLEAHRGD
jgi:hypothetical protein